MAKTAVTESKGRDKGPPPASRPSPAEHPFFELRRRMDQLFDDFSGGWPSRSLFDFPQLPDPFRSPKLAGDLIDLRFDVSETKDTIEVAAEVPGIEEKDIEVTLSEGLLTIKGEKKAESEEKKKDYHLAERHFGSFSRSFRLPDGIDENKVKARFDKGVLSVTLPKSAAAKKRQKKIAISKG